MSKCRMDMVERGNLSLPRQRDCLVHYLKCLCMVEQLFSSDSDYDSEAIMFVWYDAFCEHQVSSQRNSIQLEKAAVLFNLGAVCSQIGAACDLTTALGRHLAIDAFNAASGFFLKLWKVYAKDVSATPDLTLLLAQSMHHLFAAQASELKLQQLDKNNNSSPVQQHRCANLLRSVYKLYHRAYELMRTDLAVMEHVLSFDITWMSHLHMKAVFFQVETRQRPPFMLQPKGFSWFQPCPLDHDAESVTGKLVRGICRMISFGQLCPRDLDAESVTEEVVRKICTLSDHSIPKQQRIPYLDLLFSEYSSFKIIDGKLVANPWDMPPPYPSNLAILSSSSSSLSNMMAIPLKKTEPMDLYEPLYNYVILKYSESEAKKVGCLFQMLDKLRSEMQRDDLSLPIRRDRLICYLKCLCMIEPLFPMTSSHNPPSFVWYNALDPKEKSSKHNIHLEKASVLFNLGALSTHITLSCDLTTIQGYGLAIDTLKDASYCFYRLWKLEAEKASATIDLSASCAQMLHEIITAQIADLEWNYSHSHSDGSSLPGYPVTLHYRKAYDRSTFGPLAENLLQSSIPQFLELKMKTCHGPSDITEQFLSGYCEAQSLLQEGCQTPWLDLLSEIGPFKIKDGNLVANLRCSNVAI
ncbi:hypothetical protein PIB30_022221 [Stylosanthes scabra]|uniref:BRO1 domain-containing protein n=1 Tax=Stylosanthes scabra TaxID=79078 RepID=A0ABU6Z5U9_9FABA|nr:hypothetical protein [Stylosanthes scabra]